MHCKTILVLLTLTVAYCFVFLNNGLKLVLENKVANLLLDKSLCFSTVIVQLVASILGPEEQRGKNKQTRNVFAVFFSVFKSRNNTHLI